MLFSKRNPQQVKSQIELSHYHQLKDCHLLNRDPEKTYNPTPQISSIVQTKLNAQAFINH